MKIAHVSTFPPLRCGIANFVTDLIGSLPDFDNARYSLHYGINSAEGIRGHADVRCAEQVAALGKTISASDCDVVSLQHEFGIWGGWDGEYIFNFLDNLSKPIVSVLHTTFRPGVQSSRRKRVVRRLVKQSSRVALFTDLARQSLEALVGKEISKASVIPHGVPDIGYANPPPLWSDSDTGQASFRMITPGFIREDKGLEIILLALCRLLQQGRHISYVFAGEAPRQFDCQVKYALKAKQMIQDLGLTSNVTLLGRYLSLSEQISEIQRSHVGVFPYQDPSQASSGTVPLVMSSGRPVICTPFEYAIAKRNEIPGVMVANSFKAGSIADEIADFMDNSAGYCDKAKAVYDHTREWTWPKVGVAYAREYELAAQAFEMPSPGRLQKFMSRYLLV